MFGDYSIGDLGSIFVMQGFAGLILFSVYVLMALGLAIIFGQMGVINMAHGEFMILGAYVTWLTSSAFQHYLPALFPGYFFLAMVLAFIASGALGMLVEWGLIRHLYKRPLDTLLATWGLSRGIAGVAGSAFTMIGSTGPTSGQLYIVDTFLVVVFGGAASLIGTIASAFSISQTQSTLEFFMSGSMAKVLTLLAIVGILMLRPQGLFALKVRK